MLPSTSAYTTFCAGAPNCEKAASKSCQLRAESTAKNRGIVDGPPQRQFALLARDEIGNDRPVARRHNIQRDLLPAFHLDGFLAMLGLLPALRRKILASVVELLDVEVFDIGAEIGKAPGDALIMTDDHVRHAGQGDAGNVEVAGSEVGLVPDIGKGEGQVHIVRQQRLAGSGMGAGNDPVVGAGADRITALRRFEYMRDFPKAIILSGARLRLALVSRKRAESKDPYCSRDASDKEVPRLRRPKDGRLRSG